MTIAILWVIGGLILFPIILYVSTKLVTYGYLKARHRFEQDHQSPPSIKENGNGNSQSA